MLASLVRYDIFILLPNSLGALSGAIQLVCHALYGNYCSGSEKSSGASANAAVEEAKAPTSEEEQPAKSTDVVLV